MKKNKNRPGYRKTKVGWIPKDWECPGFGDVFSIQLGKMLSKKAREADNQEPYLANINVRWGSFDLNNLRTMSFSSKERDRYALESGDLLVCEGGEIGRCAIWKEEIKPCYYQKALHRLRPKASGVDVRFAMSYLQSVVSSPRMAGLIGETSIAHFTKERFDPFPLPLPPFPEQEAIAGVLECWDEAIRKYEEKIDKKRNIKKGLMQRLLSGDQRLPGFDGIWRMIRVRKLFRDISEKAGNRGGELLSVTQDRGAIPRTMLEGRVMSPESGTSGYKLVREGDFIISLRSFQGGLEYSAYDGLVSPAYTVLRPTTNLDTTFYKYFFKSYEFIGRYLAKAVVGIRDGKQISIPVFATVELPVPSTEEQRAIATVLSTADAEIAALQQKLDLLKNQKRYLLNNLVTGTIRLPKFRPDNSKRGTK